RRPITDSQHQPAADYRHGDPSQQEWSQQRARLGGGSTKGSLNKQRNERKRAEHRRANHEGNDAADGDYSVPENGKWNDGLSGPAFTDYEERAGDHDAGDRK